MSSHHIVRDNQEPALLIMEADHSALDIIQELLEWSPFIIVHESQLDFVLSLGIKIDAVLLPANREEEITEKVSHQWPLKFISYSADNNALDSALHFLKAGNYPSVNIITNNENQFNTILQFATPIDITIIKDKIKWSLIRAGHFEKLVGNDSSFFIHEGASLSSAILPDNDNKIRIKKTAPFWIGEQL